MFKIHHRLIELETIACLLLLLIGKMNMMIVGAVYYVGVILQLAFCDEPENTARVTNEVQMTFKLDNYQGL